MIRFFADQSSSERASIILPSPENKRYYPSLDGLRALAVLMVFFQHHLVSTFPSLGWGWAGVDIFFVLSGFLITGILYDTQNASHRFRVFYMRRTLRIFPLFYGVLFLALVTTPVMDWMWNPAWLLWACYLGNYARYFYLYSPLLPLGAIEHLVSRYHAQVDLTLYVGHFWSLCVEEQFYLVWPLVVFTVRRRETLRTLCLLALPLVLAARIACLWLLPQSWLAEEFLYRATPLRLDALLLGGLLALSLRGPEAPVVLRAAKPILFSFSIGFTIFEVLYGTISGSDHIYLPVSGDPILTTVGYTLIDIFSAALILGCISSGSPLARFFSLRPLRALGRISYGFYVFMIFSVLSTFRAVGAFIGGGCHLVSSNALSLRWASSPPPASPI